MTRPVARAACPWCGYDHDDDGAGRVAAQRWHADHDAGAGLDFELETLQHRVPRGADEQEDE